LSARVKWGVFIVRLFFAAAEMRTEKRLRQFTALFGKVAACTFPAHVRSSIEHAN
jgi:hypothetical protein